MTAALQLLLAAMLIFAVGCNSEPQSSADGTDQGPLLDLVVPATNTGGASLVEVLSSLNSTLKSSYPNHPNLPLIIERHGHPNYDSGDQKIEFNLPEQSLVERIQILSTGTLTHWRRSENGFILFKTWHRPQYAWDDEPLATDNSEQDGADQPATAPESKPEGKEKPKPESEGRSQ